MKKETQWGKTSPRVAPKEQNSGLQNYMHTRTEYLGSHLFQHFWRILFPATESHGKNEHTREFPFLKSISNHWESPFSMLDNGLNALHALP